MIWKFPSGDLWYFTKNKWLAWLRKLCEQSLKSRYFIMKYLVRMLVYFIVFILHFLCKSPGVHLKNATGIPRRNPQRWISNRSDFLSWYSYYVTGSEECKHGEQQGWRKGYEIQPEEAVALWTTVQTDGPASPEEHFQWSTWPGQCWKIEITSIIN